MILPILRGILGFKHAPATWLLFYFNALILALTVNHYVNAQADFNSYLEDDYFLKSQGSYFAQFVLDNKSYYSETIINMANKAIIGNSEKKKILGSFAIRDPKFMEEGTGLDYKGDQVALRHWKKGIQEMEAIQDRHPTFVFGLSSKDISFTKWISYQFIHSGLTHFALNMIFLLIFGSILEPVIGAVALLIVYLGTGMVAAGAFLLMTGVSYIPLVGASGAVCGLMGLFCFIFWKQPVRYFYFLYIPKRDYYGFVYLPSWITLIMWFLADMAGYMSSMREFGGVAHAAHLGGQFAGLGLGAAIFLMRYWKKQDQLVNDINNAHVNTIENKVA